MSLVTGTVPEGAVLVGLDAEEVATLPPGAAVIADAGAVLAGADDLVMVLAVGMPRFVAGLVARGVVRFD